MIVLEAETALTVAETLADNVAGGVFAPPIWMSTRDYISLSPTHTLHHLIKESWPTILAIAVVAIVVATSTTRTVWRRGRRTHLSFSLLVEGNTIKAFVGAHTKQKAE